MKRAYPLSKVYSLLEPGPVVMVSTALKGRNNIMTMSWHTMIDFNPPLVGCVISDRNHTFGIVKKTRECVINIPTLEIAKKAVACGNVSGAKVDKFREFGLTPEKASIVKASLIKECYASLECELADARMAGKYNFFIQGAEGLGRYFKEEPRDHTPPRRRGLYRSRQDSKVQVPDRIPNLRFPDFSRVGRRPRIKFLQFPH